MIITAHGDLLTADVEALVNAVNTVGVMGKGIALQFKRAYPANYAAYRAACAAQVIKLGQVHFFDSARPGPGRYVINFPTKGHWRTSSKVTDVQNGLCDLVRVVREHGISSIAVPALGCGNGGLDWNEINPLIERAFAALPDVRVLMFPPESASDSPASNSPARRTAAQPQRDTVP
ncbi:macro domain-containing protein [Micromonospora sp. NPDC049204]|uniref:macro domain-containing protein n=1 Tax=unclassified Micromonospora TaxID=2617518 RepID=UPI0033E42194